jgi:solute carrier family 10 (sodium/bile acid cotransporter), member 7
MLQTLNKLLSKIDGFVFSIFCVVAIAYYFPAWGIQKEPYKLEDLANYGVSITFFFYGLKLNIEKLKIGLANWHKHLVIQCTTFIVFPLLVLSTKSLFESAHYQELWLGLFFLSALPSTVSSSVVMTSIAGGNVPSAIFNASISSLIGLLFTPLWVGLFILSGDANFNVSAIAIKLTYQVLLPVTLGMILNSKWGNWAEKNKTKLTKFDQSVLLIIIYTAFCKSFTNNVFGIYSSIELMALGVGLLVLLASILSSSFKISKWLKFNHADTITTVFCSSKKSLVHGTVMSKILFGSNPIVGILLLPIMMYHAIQVLVTSIIARRIADKI